MRALGALGGGIAIVASSLATRGAHASGAHAFEWAGIFETPENEYVWQAQKVNDAYADATMKMVMYGEIAAGHDRAAAPCVVDVRAGQGAVRRVVEHDALGPDAPDSAVAHDHVRDANRRHPDRLGVRDGQPFQRDVADTVQAHGDIRHGHHRRLTPLRQRHGRPVEDLAFR